MKKIDLELKIALVAAVVFVVSALVTLTFVLLPLYELVGPALADPGSADTKLEALNSRRRVLGFIGNAAMFIGVVSVAVWMVKTSRKK